MDLDDLDLLLALSDAADALTMPVWLKGDPEVEIKSDGSPVTATDLAVEVTVREMVRRAWPADGFLGEEVGLTPGRSERQWIIDGIDGTSAFIAGRPEWSTLIALTAQGRVLGGAATSPALGRRWYSGIDGSAYRVVTEGVATGTVGTRTTGPERLAVSPQSSLRRASIASWPPLADVRPGFRVQATQLTDAVGEQPTKRPSWGAAAPHGAILVADGRLDAFVLFGGKAWDHAAAMAIVAAAGGRASTLDGTEYPAEGATLYSNGHLHKELLDILRPR